MFSQVTSDAQILEYVNIGRTNQPNKFVEMRCTHYDLPIKEEVRGEAYLDRTSASLPQSPFVRHHDALFSPSKRCRMVSRRQSVPDHPCESYH